MRLLVCGGRNLDKSVVWNALEHSVNEIIAEQFGSRAKITLLIHGGAHGADEGAAEWGRSEGIRVQCFAADWKKYRKAAGPIRNKRMLDEGKPDLVIAFPGGRGTENMVKLAIAYGIRVVRL